MLLDAHCHNDQAGLLEFQKQNGIQAIINCENRAEWQKNQTWVKKHEQSNNTDDNDLLSFGIHPWKVNDVDFKEMQPLLKQAQIIGEIGLDTVWTSIPLEQQLQVFKQQLTFAFETQKPVIIHTKGTEPLMLDLIKAYPNMHFMVHWYSDLNYIDEYIQAGCWFSIGVDLLESEVSMSLVHKAPIEKLFIESDGMESIKWAFDDEQVQFKQYQALLERNLQAIADIKQISINKLEKIMSANLCDFINV
ncbi:TatD DNase family protein [Weissella uvarum]|uniref:TatD family hydrolase n=1 Tax=Weissella uvarum TaxID=1479233 RepID=UPI00196034D6|nr:TatD family hydrolase [Weissella uvarum]MBM7618112.1 TatD DNase family protein [Weissella uvarum]MCM0595146.1 TatD family hydrolase [Weissella uvarum]